VAEGSQSKAPGGRLDSYPHSRLLNSTYSYTDMASHPHAIYLAVKYNIGAQMAPSLI
jgi:hypothetical protein